VLGVRKLAALPLVLILLSACTHASGEPTAVAVITENKPFPQLEGTNLAGAKFDTASLAGKPFVLNVWATWCAPCAREQPALVKLQAQFGDRVGFLGIDYRDDDSAAKAWVEQFGVHYPSLTDPSGKYAADLGFPFLPDTYVVDAKGSIRFVVFGETNQQQLTGLLDSLLGSATPTAGATPS
jgi:DsbE subfamily thiol:disulfide oxidoreductase